MQIASLKGFLRIFDFINQALILGVLASILGKSKQVPSAETRRRQYRRLVDYWVKQPLLEKFLDMIDDPQPFYSPQAIQVLQGKSYDARAAQKLREWNTNYPELAGPARFLAALLMREEKKTKKSSLMSAGSSSMPPSTG